MVGGKVVDDRWDGEVCNFEASFVPKILAPRV